MLGQLAMSRVLNVIEYPSERRASELLVMPRNSFHTQPDMLTPLVVV